MELLNWSEVIARYGSKILALNNSFADSRMTEHWWSKSLLLLPLSLFSVKTWAKMRNKAVGDHAWKHTAWRFLETVRGGDVDPLDCMCGWSSVSRVSYS